MQGNKLVKPHAYTLIGDERKECYKSIKLVKFTNDYAKNLLRNISIGDVRISSLKSHDCHVLL